jgi:hypothetical protein
VYAKTYHSASICGFWPRGEQQEDWQFTCAYVAVRQVISEYQIVMMIAVKITSALTPAILPCQKAEKQVTSNFFNALEKGW